MEEEQIEEIEQNRAIIKYPSVYLAEGFYIKIILIFLRLCYLFYVIDNIVKKMINI